MYDSCFKTLFFEICSKIIDSNSRMRSGILKHLWGTKITHLTHRVRISRTPHTTKLQLFIYKAHCTFPHSTSSSKSPTPRLTHVWEWQRHVGFQKEKSKTAAASLPKTTHFFLAHVGHGFSTRACWRRLTTRWPKFTNISPARERKEDEIR